jgi:hypothetical protein
MLLPTSTLNGRLFVYGYLKVKTGNPYLSVSLVTLCGASRRGKPEVTGVMCHDYVDVFRLPLAHIAA